MVGRGLIRRGVARKGVGRVVQRGSRVERKGGIEGRTARTIWRTRTRRGRRSGGAGVQGLIFHLLVILCLTGSRKAKNSLVEDGR
jgi:hypothetical protein